MKYDYIIFDLDGTLLDTLDDLTDSVNAALSKYSFPAVDREQVRRSVGNGVRLLMARCLPHGTDADTIETCTCFMRKHYESNCENKTRPYDGIPALLEELRSVGVRVAVVSNKFDAAVKRLCQKYFDGLIETAIGERDGVLRKPAPDAVFAALAELGADLECDLSRVIYVGDSDVDVQTAKNAGVTCAAVTWGFRDRELLISAGADLIAESADELKSFLF